LEEIRHYLNQIIERSSPESPIWNQEARLDKKTGGWSYIDGCMLIAIQSVYNTTQEQTYFSFIENFIDYYIDDEGHPLGYEPETYNCDSINEGKVLFQLYAQTKKEKYRKALTHLYQQVVLQPRTKEGSMWHKLIYPQQVWLDGLYMVQPFALEYQLTFGTSQDISDIVRQFENVVTAMKDPKTGLLFHGYDCTRSAFWADKITGCSANFWTRSIGWFAMALVDTLALLNERQEYGSERKKLQRYLQDLMEAILAYQDRETSLFYQVTDHIGAQGNYLETSGSAALSYVMLKGARLKLLPSNFQTIGKTILTSLLKGKLTCENGVFSLEDICLVAGLGGISGKGNYHIRDGSYDYYVSEPVVCDDAKGIGPFLYAYSEWLLL